MIGGTRRGPDLGHGSLLGFSGQVGKGWDSSRPLFANSFSIAFTAAFQFREKAVFVDRKKSHAEAWDICLDPRAYALRLAQAHHGLKLFSVWRSGPWMRSRVA